MNLAYRGFNKFLLFIFLGLLLTGVTLFAAVPLPSDPKLFVNLAKKSVPSVVNISTLSTVKSPYIQGGPDDLFRRFFEDLFRGQGGPRGGAPDDGDEEPEGGPFPPPNRKKGSLPKAMSLGTGFIIDSSGLILTNNHVVAEADEIKIQFTEEPDEKPTDGEVVGRDPELDVALIRVKTKRTLTALSLGDSDALEVGELVMAVGNPFGQGHSVTHGIISAKGRLAPDFPLASYLQTDAPINPGNSGGPLISTTGEVIAINNAIDQRATGIGFAIPINVVKKILPQLKSKGVVSRGYIGVLVNDLTPEIAAKLAVSKDLKAPFVTHIYPGEPADQAGLKPYDVILDFNGKKITGPSDLINAVTSVNVGETAPTKILRNGKEQTLKIKVAQRPGSKPAPKKESEKSKKPKKTPKVQTGMTLENLDAETARRLRLTEKDGKVVITNVEPDSPAELAGLVRGDIVLEVNQKAISDVDGFFDIVKEKKKYLVRVKRFDMQRRELSYVSLLNLEESDAE